MNFLRKFYKSGWWLVTLWMIVGFVPGMCVGALIPKEKSEPTFKPVVVLIEQEPVSVYEPIINNVGEFKLTAYCSCEQCCGVWAQNRPVDANGEPIVKTANGSVAKQGVTVAADTDVLPFGTVLLIDGHEYTVQDRGAAIVGNRLDVYFDNHQDALNFGVQYKEVFVKEG